MSSISKLCIRKNAIISLATQQQKRFFIKSARLSNEVRNGNDEVDEAVPKKEQKEMSLLQEVKELNDKVKELQDAYKLSLADQENLRQRHQREIQNAKDFAIQKFAKELLEPLDILSVALNSVPEQYRNSSTSATGETAEQLVNLYTGVSMTEKVLKKTLNRFGIQEEDPIDQIFDPNRHEAVFQTPVPDKKPGTIFVVQKKGYLLKDRVLRAAQVGVVSSAAEEKE